MTVWRLACKTVMASGAQTLQAHRLADPFSAGIFSRADWYSFGSRHRLGIISSYCSSLISNSFWTIPSSDCILNPSDVEMASGREGRNSVMHWMITFLRIFWIIHHSVWSQYSLALECFKPCKSHSRKHMAPSKDIILLLLKSSILKSCFILI